jgi:hypothetical protein
MTTPTRPDDDFEAQIRLALGEHAGAAHRVDLADGALSKARTIRRRRVGLTTAAVLVTLAVAVPVGTQLIDTGTTDHTASETTTDVGLTPQPAPVNVALATLPQGPAPEVPYIAGGTFFDAAGDAHPATATPQTIISDAAALEGGTLLWQRDKLDAAKLTTKVAEGGASNLPTAKSVTPPAIDQSTKAAVFALHDTDASGRPAPTDTIVYATAVNGDADTVATVDTGMQVRQVMGAYDHQVIFNAKQTGRGEVVGVVVMGADQGVSTPWDDLKTVTAVSPTEALLAGLPRPGGAFAPGQRNCSQMISADSGDMLWANCDWNPVEFSPDGTLVLAIPAYADGLGPSSLAVLDTETGSAVQEFRIRGTFGRATFDPASDAVIAVVTQKNQSSIVRCPVDGSSCELATPPAQTKSADPVSLLQPYQLTAN